MRARVCVCLLARDRRQKEGLVYECFLRFGGGGAGERGV